MQVSFTSVSCIKKYTTHFIVLLLALQILNVSVQSRPANDTNDSYMLSHTHLVNPIDHALEYIVERILHKKNAFPEDGKAHRQEPIHLVKTTAFNLYFSCYHTPLLATTSHPLMLTHKDAYAEGYNYLFASEINPPPPKV